MTDQEISPPELHFGDYTSGGGLGENTSEKSQSKQTTPAKIPVVNATLGSDDDVSDSDDKSNLLGSGGSRLSGGKQRFLSFEYYQSFFDVETHHVWDRMYASVILNWNKNFVKQQLHPNPDLYGPFWIAATLVFAIAVNGNFASLVHSLSSKNGTSTDPEWVYDLDAISTAGLIVSLYLSFVPVLFWLFLRWRKSLVMLTLLEVVCVYGYSLSVFIPASLLWLIPFPEVQWPVAAVAFCVSATALCFAFWPSLKEEEFMVSLGALTTVVLLHAGLIACFMVSVNLVQLNDGSNETLLANQSSNGNASMNLTNPITDNKGLVLSPTVNRSMTRL